MKQTNNKKGFTLVETLVTVIIVVLLTLILTELTSLASRYFTSTVKDADAQILCSTLTNAIEDELRYATNIDYDGTDFKYYSKNSGLGRKTQIVSEVVNGRNVLNIKSASGSYPLVNYGSYVYDLNAFIALTYSADNNVHINLEIKDAVGKLICSNRFSVKPLNPGYLK